MIPEYRSPCYPDRFYGNQAEVKSSVMIRAQHDDVGQRVSAAVLAREDVRDIAGGRIPAADRAAVVKLAANYCPECAGHCVDTPAGAAAGHGFAVTDAKALTGAVDLPVRVFVRLPLGRQVFDGFAARVTRLCFSWLARARWMQLLISEFARVAAELGGGPAIRPVYPGDAAAACKTCFIGNPEAWRAARHDVSLGEGKAA